MVNKFIIFLSHRKHTHTHTHLVIFETMKRIPSTMPVATTIESIMALPEEIFEKIRQCLVSRLQARHLMFILVMIKKLVMITPFLMIVWSLYVVSLSVFLRAMVGVYRSFLSVATIHHQMSISHALVLGQSPLTQMSIFANKKTSCDPVQHMFFSA